MSNYAQYKWIRHSIQKGEIDRMDKKCDLCAAYKRYFRFKHKLVEVNGKRMEKNELILL